MTLGATLYIKNTNEAVVFYQEAFGMTLGYNEKFPDGSYMHVAHKISPIVSLGISFVTENEVRQAYDYLMREGIAYREIGELPWSKCSADVLDKFGVYWYLYV